MKSYLEKRKICIKVELKTLEFFKVTQGILQGSVLGPLLFLLLSITYLKHQKLMLLCLHMTLTCVFPAKIYTPCK